MIAGLALASAVFLRLDPRVEFEAAVSDGDRVKAGQVVCCDQRAGPRDSDG